MKLRIRTKFIIILVVAAVLPLSLALIAAQSLGYRYYRKAQGALLQTRAQELARSIGLAVSGQLANLDDWAALTDLHAPVAEAASAVPALSEAEFKTQIDETEARWRDLLAGEEPLRSLLASPLSARLRDFLAINPLFVEMLVTDPRGRLLAATGRTSDYWQADEAWWQRAVQMRLHHVYVEGIHFDESARVFSIDVAAPIRDWRRPDEPAAGVIKGVINASPLLSSFTPTLSGDAATHRVVLGDGRVLAQLAGGKVEPLAERIAPEAVAKLRQKRAGWMLADLDGGGVDLAGFAPLRLSESPGETLEITGLTPMYVLVYNPADLVLAPARKQLFLLGGAGALLVLACVFFGYWLAGKEIIDPVEALRAAVGAISASAKLDEGAPSAKPLPALDPIRRIKTGDELQELAREFAYMAGRVLTYHERLETDLAAKTAETERDLQMARDFQEALMPRTYPKVPSVAHTGAVGLAFHHIYRPASSVGGDFFDVLKLSDHRAGIFIADVMGHGARSALVTAILRALLQNLAATAHDPAQFLAQLNGHFHAIIRESQETIFVSAFYIIIDTETATACYASAGHPSPFVANRAERRIAPLIDSLKSNPALGIFPSAVYQKWSRPVKAGDVFLLFTDGVHEAYNAAGEEFGLDRVSEVIAANLVAEGSEIGQAVVDAVHAFIQPAMPADDICLVTVEVTPAPAIAPTARAEAVAR